MLIRSVGKKSTIRMLKMLLPSFTVTWAIVKKFWRISDVDFVLSTLMPIFPSCRIVSFISHFKTWY